MIAIRDFSPQDLPACRVISEAAFGQGYLVADSFIAPNDQVYVADGAIGVVGFLITRRMARSAFCERAQLEPKAGMPGLVIASLAIAPDHKQQGVGRALMTHALSAATQQGLLWAGMQAWKTAAGSIDVGPLAQSLGFKPIAELANYWLSDSQESGHACSECGNAGCHCSVVFFEKNLLGEL